MSEFAGSDFSALQPGDHGVSFFEETQEQRDQSRALLEISVRQSQHALWLVPSGDVAARRQQVVDWGMQSALDRDQIQVASAPEFFLSGGALSTDDFLERLTLEHERGREQGQATLVLFVDMAWSIGVVSPAEVIPFEQDIADHVLWRSTIRICFFDRRLFSDDYLLQLLVTHGVVLMGNRVFRNFLVLNEEDFLKRSMESVLLDGWLDFLRVRSDLEAMAGSSRTALMRFIEASPHGVVVVNDEGIVVLANKAAGLALNDVVVGAPFAYSTEDGVWADVTTKQGKHLELLAVGMSWGSASARLVVCRDVTEQRQTIAALTENEVRYRELFDRMSSGVAVYRPIDEGRDFVIEDFNRSASRLEQVDRADVIGRRVTDVFPSAHASGLLDLFRRVYQTGDSEHHGPARFEERGRAAWRENWVYRLPRGEVVSVYDDRTEDMEAQAALEQKERELRRAQRMEAVAQLAGGVAHDFNNMLTVVRGFGELARSQTSVEDPVRKHIDRILDATSHSAELTGKLLMFSRSKQTEETWSDLGAVVQDMEPVLRTACGDRIDLALDVTDGTSVQVDRSEVEQVLLNLVINARDAMPGGGEVRVSVREVVVDEQDVRSLPLLELGRYVRLDVEDDGIGMDEETQMRVFDPFFTTKEPGKGTGLGLSTVYSIVTQASGAISLESEMGEGTRFSVFFPCVVGDPVTLGARQSSGELEAVRAQGAETILVVEDEETVRELVVRSLEMSGYGVMAACDGAEALSLIDERADEVQLVLTDLVMPRLSGVELAQRLAAVHPDLPVCFMSGYGDDVIPQEVSDMVRRHLLHKPFSLDKLLALVRGALDGRL